MAKWASMQPGLAGLGLMKLVDLPKWLFFSFSSNDLSVALGNMDSSSKIDSTPMGCRHTPPQGTALVCETE